MQRRAPPCIVLAYHANSDTLRMMDLEAVEYRERNDNVVFPGTAFSCASKKYGCRRRASLPAKPSVLLSAVAL